MSFLIDFGIKATLVICVTFVIAFAMRRGSASARYALWTCALTAVLLLPVASWIGPGWNMPAGSAWRRATPVVEQTGPSVSVVVQARRPASVPWPVIIWMAGVIAVLSRIAAGHYRVRSLFGSAEQLRDPRWLALAGEAAARVGLRRTVVLKRSMATDVPLSYGLFRATVLLPGEADNWSDERRLIVLSHEMTHARRLDLLWGLVAQTAVAVNWFNPLVWLAAKQFRKERERSCDDAVVTAGTASTVYAAHLVEVARAIALPEAALGMADGFDLEGRVHALLDPARNRTAVSRRVCAAMLAGALALMVPLAAMRAQSGSASVPQASIVAPVEHGEGVAVASTKKEVAISTPMRRAPAREHPAASEEPQASPRTGIAGSVYDPSGAVIPHAMISLKNTGGANEEAAVADAAGGYKLQGIPAGEYLVKVSAPGFATYQKTLTLEPGASATMNFSLEVGEVVMTEEIVAKRPPLGMPSGAPQRIRVGGMVQPIHLISKTSPVYPADAQAEGVEGTVLLRAVVSKDGGLLHVTPVSGGDQRLVTAAVASTKKEVAISTPMRRAPAREHPAASEEP
ncbi:MAG: M56 family metallopeptidase, partial [Bryobacteraceae bacterium]